MEHTYTMEYYTAIRRNELTPSAAAMMGRDHTK